MTGFYETQNWANMGLMLPITYYVPVSNFQYPVLDPVTCTKGAYVKIKSSHCNTIIIYIKAVQSCY